jgi:hypothetical protein
MVAAPQRFAQRAIFALYLASEYKALHNFGVEVFTCLRSEDCDATIKTQTNNQQDDAGSVNINH